MSKFACFEPYTSVFQLNKICAFIDAQGFSYGAGDISNTFYFIPCELSAYGSTVDEHITYKFGVAVSCLTENHRTSYMYQTRYHHGIPYNANKETDVYSQEKLREDIKRLYNQSKQEGREYFGVKNQFLAKILLELNIKFVDFASPFVVTPTLDILDKEYREKTVCSLHTFKTSRSKLVCSKRKVHRFFNWVILNRPFGYTHIF